MIIFTTDDLISVGVWIGAAILCVVFWALDSWSRKDEK